MPEEIQIRGYKVSHELYSPAGSSMSALSPGCLFALPTACPNLASSPAIRVLRVYRPTSSLTVIAHALCLVGCDSYSQVERKETLEIVVSEPGSYVVNADGTVSPA